MTRRDVDEAVLQIAARQHDLISAAQLRDAGGDRHLAGRRLRAGTWTNPHPGVYLVRPREHLTWRQRVMAAVLAAGPGAAASRSTAAALRAVEGWPEGGPIEISIRSKTRQRVAGAKVHRSVDLCEQDITEVDGIPCTTLARTLIDLGATKKERNVARAIDSSAAKRKVSYKQLRECFNRLAKRGRDGIGLVRALLDVRDPAFVPPASELEARFFALLVHHGIVAPVPQFSAPWRTDGRERVDFAWVLQKVIVECDGRAWHDRLHSSAVDKRRDRLAARHGWIVIRVTWEDVTLFPDELMSDLRAILADRAATAAA